MIIENLRMIQIEYGDAETTELNDKVDAIIARYEKLIDDICAAAQMNSGERVMDIIEQELEE
jgi:DNA-directed RNA polymerase beta' subunit